MSYVIPFDATEPNGAIVPAKQLAIQIRKQRDLIIERIEAILGVDFADDPLLVTKVGLAIAILTKNAYTPEYAGGNAGANFVVNVTTNGNNQKITLNGNCGISWSPIPPAGTTGYLAAKQDGTGGWAIVFSAGHVRFNNNVAPVVITTANTNTTFSWRSDGTLIEVYVAGTGIPTV